ncbi:NusG domain II-containing protein [Spirochaeta africana]|uniref:Uncharacterized protein n=1 Tax=Spirochaeta africana (strain ATCC 700263 / DSM 8902 / Z-7692) TaxID=889378 RepID=H9UG00_SPIAZ|nr:NusG domain II-containing protein [Spirochaeta africana]AFG36443.1 hypothetical protein Spiaf_0337 [Spirochaeta africana DSM 8902]
MSIRQIAVETIKSMRPFDWVALALAIGLSAGATMLAQARYGESSTVAIQAEGRSLLYSLDEDRVLEFEGPLGRTVVVIEDRRVRVVEDPGPLQICVRDGWIDRGGEWLICLPNRVFIRIEGSQEDAEVDASVF